MKAENQIARNDLFWQFLFNNISNPQKEEKNYYGLIENMETNTNIF